MHVDPALSLQAPEAGALAAVGFGLYGSILWLLRSIARRARVTSREAAHNLLHFALTKVGDNGDGRHRWETLRAWQPYIRTDCRHLRQPGRHDRWLSTASHVHVRQVLPAAALRSNVGRRPGGPWAHSRFEPAAKHLRPGQVSWAGSGSGGVGGSPARPGGASPTQPRKHHIRNQPRRSGAGRVVVDNVAPYPGSGRSTGISGTEPESGHRRGAAFDLGVQHRDRKTSIPRQASQYNLEDLADPARLPSQPQPTHHHDPSHPGPRRHTTKNPHSERRSCSPPTPDAELPSKVGGGMGGPTVPIPPRYPARKVVRASIERATSPSPLPLYLVCPVYLFNPSPAQRSNTSS